MFTLKSSTIKTHITSIPDTPSPSNILSHSLSNTQTKDMHNNNNNQGGGPCGACKFLRRKCVKGCVFAPYFEPNERGTADFEAVHRVFGAKNVAKLLLITPPHNRIFAVISLCYEALSRIRDPVYGCVAQVFNLQQQVDSLQAQLAFVRARLSILKDGRALSHESSTNNLLMLSSSKSVAGGSSLTSVDFGQPNNSVETSCFSSASFGDHQLFEQVDVEMLAPELVTYPSGHSTGNPKH